MAYTPRPTQGFLYFQDMVPTKDTPRLFSPTPSEKLVLIYQEARLVQA